MSGEDVDMTEDGRYIVVNGAKWRASDPNIPGSLRTELVKELMAARRAVKEAKGEPQAVSAARRRVHSAKVALGERGQPWWEPCEGRAPVERIVHTIRALLSARDAESVCPSDVALVVATPGCQPLMETIGSVGRDMAASGEISLAGGGIGSDPTDSADPMCFVKGPSFGRQRPSDFEQ